MADLLVLHRRALLTAAEIVARVQPAQLALPTPCAQWTLGGLLAHMTVQNLGFAAAARGEKTELPFWDPHPGGDFAASVDELLTAFAAEGVLERAFWLPELSTEVTFAGKQAVSFQFIDSVVHGWDVAKSIGVQAEFDDEVLSAVLPMTLTVPGGESRDRQNSMFAREFETGPQAPTLDQVVAWLGRDPGWKAS